MFSIWYNTSILNMWSMHECIYFQNSILMPAVSITHIWYWSLYVYISRDMCVCLCCYAWQAFYFILLFTTIFFSFCFLLYPSIILLADAFYFLVHCSRITPNIALGQSQPYIHIPNTTQHHISIICWLGIRRQGVFI